MYRFTVGATVHTKNITFSTKKNKIFEGALFRLTLIRNRTRASNLNVGTHVGTLKYTPRILSIS